MIGALLHWSTTSAPNGTATHSISNSPFAWGGVLLAGGVVGVLGIYLLTSSSTEKRKHMRTYAAYGLAIAAFLVFTHLLDAGEIGTDIYTSLLSFAFGGGIGYKVNERGHDKGKETALEMARELAAETQDQPPSGTPAESDED